MATARKKPASQKKSTSKKPTVKKPAVRKYAKKPAGQKAHSPKKAKGTNSAASPFTSFAEPLDTLTNRPAAKDRYKPPKPKTPRKPLHLDRYVTRYGKRAAIVAGVLAGIGFFASPVSYPAWGLVVDHSVSLSVLDSEFGLPIPGLNITINGEPVEYRIDGSKLILENIPTGTHTVQISGDGYRPQSFSLKLSPTRSLTEQPSQSITLAPTSRHIQVTVTNAISRLPVAGVTATTAKGTTAGAEGRAIIVAPPDATSVEATIAAPGYDSKTVTFAIEPGKLNVEAQLTPTGRAYFFSKTGTAADLYSVALDGSDPKIVLPASGTESVPPAAVRSPDLRWVAFTSDRNSPGIAKLYLFDTTTNTVSTVNDEYARFDIVGWTKQNSIVYTLERQTTEFQPAGKYQLHRFNPNDGLSRMIFSNRSLPTNTSKNYKRDQEGYVGIYEELYADPIIQDDYIVYLIRREAKPGYGHLLPPRSYITIVDINGTSQRTIRVNVGGYLYPVNLGNGKIAYTDYSSGEKNYELELATGKETEVETKTTEAPKKIRSPNNSKIAWAEKRDGANSIIVADAIGQNERIVATGFGLTVHGWFGEEYLFLDGNDTVFTMQIVALAGGNPLKLVDILK